MNELVIKTAFTDDIGEDKTINITINSSDNVTQEEINKQLLEIVWHNLSEKYDKSDWQALEELENMIKPYRNL